MEEIECAQTLIQLNEMKENNQKSKWESIGQLNKEKLATFEAWLSNTTSKMICHLEKLENDDLSLKNAPSTSTRRMK